MDRRPGSTRKAPNVSSKQPLDKKVPRNPKYERVGPVVKTGKTIKQVEVLSNQSVAKRKGELFKRIRPSTVSKLIEETQVAESIYSMGGEEVKDIDDSASVFSYAPSEAPSMASVVTVNTEALGITEDSEYVVLDLRDPEEFEKCHIKEAINFPAPNITRDRMIPQMFRMVNFT